MPKYYLHLHANGTVWDDEGRDFDDLDAAKVVATAGFRDIVADDIKTGVGIDFKQTIVISDAGGLTVHTTTFEDSIPIKV